MQNQSSSIVNSSPCSQNFSEEFQIAADLIAAKPKIKKELSLVIKSIGNREFFTDKLKEKFPIE